MHNIHIDKTYPSAKEKKIMEGYFLYLREMRYSYLKSENVARIIKRNSNTSTQEYQFR